MFRLITSKINAAVAQADASRAEADARTHAAKAAAAQMDRLAGLAPTGSGAVALGDYKSATRTRLRSGSRPQGGSDNWHADPLTRDNIRRDGRSLGRNNADARAMAKRLADLLVGDGMVTRSTAADAEIASAYTAYFNRWAVSRTPDRLGVRTFWQMLHAIAKVPVFEGDGLIVKVRDGGTPQLQWIESERIINQDSALVDNENMVGGCELRGGKIVAYHVAEWSKNGSGAYTQNKTRRLKAADVIPVRNIADDGLAQVRSVAALNAGLETLQLVEEMEYNATVAGAMAAIFGLLVKSEFPGETQAAMELATSDQTETNTSKPQDIDLRPGMVQHLKPGESVEQVKAEQPNLNVPAYTRSMVGKVGADLGIAFTFSHLNLEGMTASNARALLAVQQRILELAHSQMHQIVVEVWKFVIGAGIENGELPFADDFDQVDVVAKAPPQVDLNADIDASIKLRDNLLSSGRREAERLGTGDYAAIVAECGREAQLEQAAGVARVLKPGATPPASQNAAPDNTQDTTAPTGN
jgi:capsid protein